MNQERIIEALHAVGENTIYLEALKRILAQLSGIDEDELTTAELRIKRIALEALTGRLA